MRQIQFLLIVLAIATVAGFVATQTSSGIFEATGLVRGWDFQQFYLAGRLIADGKSDALYDVAQFQALQQSLLPVDAQNIPYVPLYPPMIALVVTPLAKLPYSVALFLWWGFCTACYVGSCWLLARRTPRRYRLAAILAMCGFFPFFVALRAGQLTPILLLFAVVGLRYRSGLALSLLAWKPQFGCGIFLYFALRRRWRVCLEMVAGVLLQFALVSLILGPQVLFEYVTFARIYAQHSDIYTFPAGWVHSLGGMAGMLVHLPVLFVVSGLLVVTPKCKWKVESALAVCFMLLATPHLLLYDLTFLAIPAVMLLGRHWRFSAALLFGASAVIMPLYANFNLSIVPILLIYLIVYFCWKSFDQMRRARNTGMERCDVAAMKPLPG